MIEGHRNHGFAPDLGTLNFISLQVLDSIRPSILCMRLGAVKCVFGVV